MKYKTPLLTSALMAATVSMTAAEPDFSKLPPPAKQKGVTYAKDIRPIFETSCFRCHGEEKHKGKLRLDSLESALKGGEDGKVIEPGQSEKSLLVIAVARLDEEKAMPPKPKAGRGRRPGHPPGPAGPGGPGGPPRGPGGPPPNFGPPPKPLTPAQVSLIRAWIDQGAK